MPGPSIADMNPEEAFAALDRRAAQSDAGELFHGCLNAFDSPHWAVRKKASKTLLAVGQQKGLVDALKNAYSNGTTDQRYWIMKILAQLLGGEILPWIKKMYSTTKEASLRTHAISAAAEIRSQESNEFLVATLRDDSWLNRYAAANYIEERGQDVIKFLQRGFTEGSGDLKYWCLRLIVRILGPESIGTIRKGMKSDDASLRHYVLRSMENVTGEWVVPLLIEYLGDSNWSNRRVASEMLRSRGRHSLKYLARAVEDPERDVRFWAIKTLGETGDERAVKALEQFLYTCDERDEGMWALEGLSKIPCASSARAILEASYEYPEHYEEIKALLKHLAIHSLRPIIEYLDSPNQTIQRLCHDALDDLEFKGLSAFRNILDGLDKSEREDLLTTMKQIPREQLESLLDRRDLSIAMLQARAANAPVRNFPTMSTISVLVNPEDGRILGGASENSSSLEGQEQVDIPSLPHPRSQASKEPARLSTSLYPVSLREILEKAVRLNASDIHLKASLPPIFRIHGSLRQTDLPVISPEHALDFAREVLPKDKFETVHSDLTEIDGAYSVEKLGRFRVNCYHEFNGVCIAMRHIPGKVSTIADLKLPRIFRDLCLLRQGLVLVTGPTGSGKSTTIAALIDHINTNREEHIITVEDPVEFVHENRSSIITSRELGLHTHSFSNALKAALREDPDVILVGEMRDMETMRLAITAAETGHLVLSTLHTSNPAETVDRIINTFPAAHHSILRASLADSLQAIVTQILVPTTDGKRAAIRDVLIKTPAVANLIRDDRLHQVDQAIVSGRQEGMQTRDDDLTRLLKEGRITRETAYAHCTDKKTFLQGGNNRPAPNRGAS